MYYTFCCASFPLFPERSLRRIYCVYPKKYDTFCCASFPNSKNPVTDYDDASRGPSHP